MFVVYKFSHDGNYFDLVKLLLLSLAINIFIWGVINFFIYNITKLSNINIYQLLAGTLEGIYVNEFLIIAGTCIFSFVYFFILLDKIHILSVGEEFAITTGVNVEKLKVDIFILVSVLSTVITITFGIVPFLGIIVPHFVRMCVKANIYIHFFIILIFGAFLLLLADTISVLITKYFNLPIFVLVNLFAFPFFLYFIIKR